MPRRSSRVAVGVAAFTLLSLLLATSAFAVTITSFTPPNGMGNVPGVCPGSMLVISGSGFTGTSSVTFNGLPAATFTVGTDATLYAMAPPNVTTGPITVTAPGGSVTSAATFTVFPCATQAQPTAVASPTSTQTAPTISSFTPKSGTPPTSKKAGTAITINGTEYMHVKSLEIGGVAASFSVLSANSIRAHVPKHAKSGKITITTTAGTVASSGTFKVT